MIQHKNNLEMKRYVFVLLELVLCLYALRYPWVNQGSHNDYLVKERVNVPETYPWTEPAPVSPNGAVEDLDSPIACRKGVRNRRQPKRMEDAAPEPGSRRMRRGIDVAPDPLAGLPISMNACISQQSPSSEQASCSTNSVEILDSTTSLDSPKNRFGLFRRYYGRSFPRHDPDSICSADKFVDPEGTEDSSIDASSTGSQDPPSQKNISKQDTTSENTTAVSFNPLPDAATYEISRLWYLDGAMRSQDGLVKLMKIVTDDAFDKEVARSVNWKTIGNRLAASMGEDSGDTPSSSTGWKCSPVPIQIPYHRRMSQPGTETYTLKPGFWHRNLVSVIKEKVQDPDHFENFVTEPYELYFQPDESSGPQRVHGELYTSDAFLKEHQRIQDSSSPRECSLEKVVVGLMFASDVSHLAQFSDKKIWPLYLAFGNDSKYMRAKPSNRLIEHIASFEKVRVIFEK
jgi:hypothetical protein